MSLRDAHLLVCRSSGDTLKKRCCVACVTAPATHQWMGNEHTRPLAFCGQQCAVKHLGTPVHVVANNKNKTSVLNYETLGVVPLSDTHVRLENNSPLQRVFAHHPYLRMGSAILPRRLADICVRQIAAGRRRRSEDEDDSDDSDDDSSSSSGGERDGSVGSSSSSAASRASSYHSVVKHVRLDNEDDPLSTVPLADIIQALRDNGNIWLAESFAAMPRTLADDKDGEATRWMRGTFGRWLVDANDPLAAAVVVTLARANVANITPLLEFGGERLLLQAVDGRPLLAALWDVLEDNEPFMLRLLDRYAIGNPRVLDAYHYSGKEDNTELYTLLHAAAEHLSVEGTRMLLATGAVQYRTAGGRGPLHTLLAYAYQDAARAAQIIRHYNVARSRGWFFFMPDAPDKTGSKLLGHMLSQPYPALVETWLESLSVSLTRVRRVDASFGGGVQDAHDTPMYRTSAEFRRVIDSYRPDSLRAAVRNKNVAEATALLNKGAYPYEENDDGHAPLVAVAVSSHYPSVEMARLLLAHNYSPRMIEGLKEWRYESTMDTLLMVAITNTSDPKLVRLLFEYNAAGDIHARNDDGRTVMHLTAASPYEEIQALVSLLAEKGCDINTKDAEGDTPLDVALDEFNSEAATLLVYLGAQGLEPMMHAAGNLMPGVIRALAKRGFDVNAVDRAGETALYRAAVSGIDEDYEDLHKERRETLQTLVMLGADIRGQSAFLLTDNIRSMPLSGFKMLLEMGADPNAVKPSGKTVLQVMREHEILYREYIPVLLEAGARDDNNASPTPMQMNSCLVCREPSSSFSLVAKQRLCGDCLAFIGKNRRSSGNSNSEPLERVELVRVVDGDTVVVSTAQQTQMLHVRLSRIDAPEKKQEYGMESARVLSKLLLSGTSADDKGVLMLQREEQDRYGRTVGTLYVDGKDINAAMLKAGAAWHYTQYDRSLPAVRERYASLEAKARAKKIGLWADNAAQEPWLWRRARRNKH
jgi:endonuclease YncB( thermonuclease family)